MLPLDGVPSGQGAQTKPYAWLATPYDERNAQFSPDGRWVAYQSNESGRFEIYAAPFLGPGGKRQISTDGGTYPRWRADGREIFYVSSNNTLAAAAVSVSGASLEVGAVRALGIPGFAGATSYMYDVSADGQRFLVAAPREQKASTPLTLIQNWPALLNRK